VGLWPQNCDRKVVMESGKHSTHGSMGSGLGDTPGLGLTPGLGEGLGLEGGGLGDGEVPGLGGGCGGAGEMNTHTARRGGARGGRGQGHAALRCVGGSSSGTEDGAATRVCSSSAQQHAFTHRSPALTSHPGRACHSPGRKRCRARMLAAKRRG
jgi:hypothetical protein